MNEVMIDVVEVNGITAFPVKMWTWGPVLMYRYPWLLGIDSRMNSALEGLSIEVDDLLNCTMFLVRFL
jgi:hypothetical protein